MPSDKRNFCRPTHRVSRNDGIGLGKFRCGDGEISPRTVGRSRVPDRGARGRALGAGRRSITRAVRHLRTGTGSTMRMGYIVALVLIIVVVPLLFVLLSQRKTSAGGLGARSRDRGVTVSKPSADAPTPRADAVNQVEPGVEKRLPPG